MNLRLRPKPRDPVDGNLEVLAALHVGFALFCLWGAWQAGIGFFRDGLPARFSVGGIRISFDGASYGVVEAMFVSWFISVGFANFVAARWLMRRDKYVLVFAIALANSFFFFPLGLILAVVTMVMLLRPSHRAHFKRAY